MNSFERFRSKLRDPGFTPGRRDVGPLLELLGAADENEATKVIRSLAGVTHAVERATAEWKEAAPPLRHRLVALVARSKTHADVLRDALADGDPRTRKAAARGLGRVEGHAPALREALARETRPEVERALLEALGKVGTAADMDAVSQTKGDVHTERVRREAHHRLTRDEAREVPSRIAPEREVPCELELRCRNGLEPLLAGELPGSHVNGPGIVLTSARSLREVAIARIWTTVAVVLHRGTHDDPAAIIRRSAPLLRSMTEGVVRWRVEWVGAGHRRSATRALAEQASESGFINDPMGADWEIEVLPDRVVAIPKSWDDGRFAYRVADVPAASHPTIAAALARAAGRRDDDAVWDPFVGSGLELVERARIGGCRMLIGTDTDERALAAARKNLKSADVRGARLERADARTFRPEEVTLVITNPPMGRRIQAAPELGELLSRSLENITQAIVRGGRLVWITPHPRATNRVLERARMRMTRNLVVDMRGFAANLQCWTRT